MNLMMWMMMKLMRLPILIRFNFKRQLIYHQMIHLLFYIRQTFFLLQLFSHNCFHSKYFQLGILNIFHCEGMFHFNNVEFLLEREAQVIFWAQVMALL
jgi:hypothetical protein